MPQIFPWISSCARAAVHRRCATRCHQREADGLFVLYSVGWNETDDGGVVVFKKGSSPDVNVSEGDWVWRYPQK